MTLSRLCRAIACACLGALLVGNGAAQSEPGALADDVLSARFPMPSVRYASPALAAGRIDFTQQAELAALVDRLVTARRAERIELGMSGAGIPIQALRFTRGAGRPTALLIGQQHGDEPAGGEALLAVALVLADADSVLARVLDRIDVVILPRANPDGALLARRGNALGLDPNRDHLLLATPEAAAMARLALAFDPMLVVDAHEYRAAGRLRPPIDGLARHDLLLQLATTPNQSPALVQAGDAWFRRPLMEELKGEGLTADWYHVRSGTPGRLVMGGIHPALARNAFGLRHAVSILLESRGLDLGRRHFERRVHAHVVAVSSLLRSAAEHVDELTALRAEAVQAERARACSGTLVVDAAMTREEREMEFIDPDTGADKTVRVSWDSALALRPLTLRARPCGYWLSSQADQAVDRLRALGLRVQVLDAEISLQTEAYREVARSETEDHTGPLRLTVDLVPERHLAPAGSFYVPLDQPLAALASAALEPDSGHSHVAHRLLKLDQVRRVLQAP